MHFVMSSCSVTSALGVSFRSQSAIFSTNAASIGTSGVIGDGYEKLRPQFAVDPYACTMFPNRKRHLERVPEILEPFTGASVKLHRHRRIPRNALPYDAGERFLHEVQDNLPDSASVSSGTNRTLMSVDDGPPVPLGTRQLEEDLPARRLAELRIPLSRQPSDDSNRISDAASLVSAELVSLSVPHPLGIERNGTLSHESIIDMPPENVADQTSQRTVSGSSSASTSRTSGSSTSGDSTTSTESEEPNFVETLPEDMRQLLRDGEDFDYMGLYAHPSYGVDDEKIRENIKTQKDILGKIKEQPWRMRRKLKMYRLAHAYVERYEGRYLRRGASVANFAKLLKTVRRFVKNLMANLVPWEERIKTVENRFGSAGASYFIFLRWMIGVNIVIATSTAVAVMMPQVLFGPDLGTTYRTTISSTERATGWDITTVYRYAGFMFYTPIYYGFYSNEPQFKGGYRLPLAYFCTTLAVLVFSYWVVLAKMATNVRLSAENSDSDQYMFSTRTYCSWDFMIANRDTADNKGAAITRSFKELLVDEEHKGREENKWVRLALRILAWVITLGLLALSTYILLLITDWKRDFKAEKKTFWETNAVSLTLKAQMLIFPELFERMEYLEEYHPLVGLRLHLARITVLQLLANGALIRTWVYEAREQVEEAEGSRADFPWIWNSSIPRPVNWQQQTSRPALHHGESGAAYHASGGQHEATQHGTGNAHDQVGAGHDEASEHGASEHGMEHAYVDPHSDHGEAHSAEHEPATGDHSAPESAGENEQGSMETSAQATANKEPNFSLVDELPLVPEEEEEAAPPSDVVPSDHGPNFSVADEISPGGQEFEQSSGLVDASITKTVVPDPANPDDYDYFTPGPIPNPAANTEPPTTADIRILVNGTLMWPTRSLPPRPPTTPVPTAVVTHPPITIDKLKSLCWENKVAQEGLENLVTESVASVVEILAKECVRGVLVRYLTPCWFWDLERFPGYSPFTVSENVLSLVVAQQMTWIGFFFAPALAPINLVRLIFLMYFRAWATQVCDVPPETMFNTGKGNNFYFLILLLMLFVSTLFIGYTVCFLQPSWQCGPFSRYEKMYEVVTETFSRDIETSPIASEIVDYIKSPALILPLLLLLFIIIFYLFSMGMALTRKTKDLKRTLELERTEERRKMMAQMEAREKRKAKLALGDTAATEVFEVTIDEASDNALTLLDKMKNRGFPPEEKFDPGKGHGEPKPHPHRTHHLAHHLKDAATKVLVLNSVIRRISQAAVNHEEDILSVHDETESPVTTQITSSAQPPSVVSPLNITTNVSRAREKFKKGLAENTENVRTSVSTISQKYPSAALPTDIQTGRTGSPSGT